MGEPARELHLGTLLGKGGMGEVYEAIQPHLGRTIAVKRVRIDREGAGPVRALLAEARVTGAVAHPGVVPVHEVQLGATGGPEILLKRIHGRAWSQLLRDPRAVTRLHGATDLLQFHVGVLEQVCAAVHAAHTRNILHRDLKPGNVMVGRHGEVYVLDWGLGVTLDAEADARLPRPTGEGGAGTPQYMAPEMVSDRYGELGPWSDVYLLGGLLHQILFGRAPHHGSNVWNLVVEACRTGVTVPDEGPPELVDLCRRCLARRPEDRVQDAETVRRALRTWLEHLPSHDLCDRARALEREMEALFAEDVGEAHAHPRLHETYGAAVFAWQRALDVWPENPEAHEGRIRTTCAFVEHALAQRRPAEADAALASLDEPPEDLSERVRVANAPVHEGAMPWLLAAGVGVLALRAWTTLGAWLLGTLDTTTLLAVDVASVGLILGGVGLGLRHGLRPVHQRIAAFGVLMVGVAGLLDAGALRAGLPALHVVVLHPALLLVGVLLASLVFRRHFMIGAVTLALVAAAGIVAPWAGPALLLPGYLALALQGLTLPRNLGPS